MRIAELSEYGLKTVLMLGSSAIVFQALGVPLQLPGEHFVQSSLGATAAMANDANMAEASVSAVLSSISASVASQISQQNAMQSSLMQSSLMESSLMQSLLMQSLLMQSASASQSAQISSLIQSTLNSSISTSQSANTSQSSAASVSSALSSTLSSQISSSLSTSASASTATSISITSVSIWASLSVITSMVSALGSSGTAPQTPIMPTSSTPDGGFVFDVPVLPGSPTFFDPPVAVGYDYSVADGSPLIIASVFPLLAGDPDGYDVYAFGDTNTLLFGGVLGGQTIDFTSLPNSQSGITGFSLRSINPAAGLDPANANAFVTGLTFGTAGIVTLTQTPVVINYTPGIPEPAAWAMLITGFGLVGVTMRRRSQLVSRLS